MVQDVASGEDAQLAMGLSNFGLELNSVLVLSPYIVGRRRKGKRRVFS